MARDFHADATEFALAFMLPEIRRCTAAIRWGRGRLGRKLRTYLSQKMRRTFILPAMLVGLDRMGLLPPSPPSSPPTTHLRPLPAVRVVVAASAVLSLLAFFGVSRLSFEYDFSKLEPIYAEYEALAEHARKVFPSSPYRNAAFIVVDEAREVDAVIAALRAHSASDVDSPTIGRIAALQDCFPLTVERQREKLARIAAMRQLLAEAARYEPSPELVELSRAAGTLQPIGEEQLPDFLAQRFRTRSGELGRIVAVYPSVGLVDGCNSLAFADDVGRVQTADGKVYWAGSTPLVAAAMLRLMLREIPWTVAGVACVVALLMWISFASLRWALVALLPLAVGVLWMLLAQAALGLDFNLYNIVVLPAILGIGNDAGAHLVHRYRQEGRGSLRRVLRSTGEHVSVGSLTTAMGFSGLLFSRHPGLCSMGELALVGIATTWLAAIVFLPALLQCLESLGWFGEKPILRELRQRSWPVAVRGPSPHGPAAPVTAEPHRRSAEQ